MHQSVLVKHSDGDTDAVHLLQHTPSERALQELARQAQEELVPPQPQSIFSWVDQPSGGRTLGRRRRPASAGGAATGAGARRSRPASAMPRLRDGAAAAGAGSMAVGQTQHGYGGGRGSGALRRPASALPRTALGLYPIGAPGARRSSYHGHG